MIYLDNAATSWPKPNEVTREMIKCITDYCANPGRSGHKMSILSGEKIFECRENLSKLFNIESPTSIVFTNNATHAINIGLKGILKTGDHVLTSSVEHNSVIRPLKKLVHNNTISLDVINSTNIGLLDTDDLTRKIKKNTKLLVISHASNVTGLVNDLETISKIAKKNNIIFMVDASQTAGVFPIDIKVMGIDLLAFPGHKGLLGPQGTGGLYVNTKNKLDTLIEGGTGSLSESEMQPDFYPDRLESGTLNTPGIVGLNEGVKYILKIGTEYINSYEKSLSNRLITGLLNIKGIRLYCDVNLTNRVGIVPFTMDGRDCVEVCNLLNSNYNIAARCGLHCAYLTHKTLKTLDTGVIRLSVGIFNTKREIETTLKAINDISKNII